MKKLFVIIGFLGILSLSVSEASAQYITDQSFVDGIYVENATGVKEPMPLPTIREADVMWKKTIWREIDFNQKINQGFYFPIIPHQNWQNLITVLMNGLKSGEITAYADEITSTGELINPISHNKIVENTTLRGTTKRLNDETGELEDVAYEEQLKSEDVTRCRVKEIWYFDKQRSQMMVRIIAICPVRLADDGNGNMVTEPLFWVPYNDATRRLLAKSPYFNRHNSAAQLSYDEVFIKRMFDSYIYREENMYDRNIKDYAKGVEALNESEQIKQSIIDFEQQLWEY